MKQRLFGLLALCGALLVGACTTASVKQMDVAGAVPVRVLGAATLARAGTCEVDVAAVWSGLSLSRQRAAEQLQGGRITVAQARQVQALADAARVDLDAACPNDRAALDAARLAKARQSIAAAGQILEKKP